MGTVVRIEAYVQVQANPVRIFRSAFDRVADLAWRLSSYRDDSEIRRLERDAWRERVRVSDELAVVLGAALRLARESGGAFDPTLGTVTHLLEGRPWGEEGPAPHLLRRAWTRTGWQNVDLDESGRSVLLREHGMRLDLGGIAKGFIADEALKVLSDEGVERAMVSVAGDIAVGGAPPGRPGWSVGLDAVGERNSIEQTLVVDHRGVSTSGSRERYFVRDGKRCSHVWVWQGETCTENSMAVSVLAESAMEADGLATALLALGPEESARLLSRYPMARAFWQAQAGAGPANSKHALEVGR